ncbi:MarR family winged helix-turn-helix transcriptional regulator [Roseomonas sp. WA12]
MAADTTTLAELFRHETLGAPENAVGFVLWRVVHRYVREIDRTLGPVGLTHLQFTALAMAAWMARSGEPVTQVALARLGDIHPMQVSQVLKALETKGMAARPRSEADARARHVEVTEAGVAALRQAMPLVIAVQAKLFGAAGQPGGELLAVLRRIDRDGSDRH